MEWLFEERNEFRKENMLLHDEVERLRN